jgi:hypothetical protein
MLKEAIEKIVELAHPKTYEIGGRTFYDDGSTLTEYRPKVILPGETKLTSLDALVTMVKTEALKTQKPPLYIQVDRFNHVSCFTQPADEAHEFFRTALYSVDAIDVPGFRTGFMSHEQAMIALRCDFQTSDDLAYLLNLLSRIDVSGGVTSSDNGVTQQVETQKGIALKEYENIRPTVNLKPYRTFQEVDQPETAFLCRVNDKCEIGLFEADGGMWKLQARENVKDFLKQQLTDEVTNAQVYITL